MRGLSTKDPSEIIAVSADFTNITDTFASASWSISVKFGTDASVSTMLLGSPQNGSGLSTHLIRNGVDGVIYLLRCDITLASGEKYAVSSLLAVETLDGTDSV